MPFEIYWILGTGKRELLNAFHPNKLQFFVGTPFFYNAVKIAASSLYIPLLTNLLTTFRETHENRPR